MKVPRLLIALIPCLVAAGLVAAALVVGGSGVHVLFPLSLWTIVGAIVAARQPRNAIGWIFVAVGLIFTSGSVAEGLANLAYGEGRPFRGAVIAAWYTEWSWLAGLALLLIFPPLLFPTGRLSSRAWRPALWLAVATTVAFTLLAGLDPKLDPVDEGRFVPVENPIGIASLGDVEEGGTSGALLIFACLSMLLAVASLIARFRRSRGEERQQLKWFTYAGALLVFGFLALGVADGLGLERGLDLGYSVLFALPPVAVAVAILRHRLFDIDLVINRTLVYGSVTAILAGAYLGLVLLFQLAFSSVTEGSGLAVALSTLAVAAFFRPARNRVQALVDRRFYRRKYDAQRTLEGFASRLRDEVDLDSLSAELTGVVGETMQPAHVSLWLREAVR